MNFSRLLLIATLCAPLLGWSIDPTDAHFLREPAISDQHIAFIYANDLWIANKDGSSPRRLTIHQGIESHPYFSPDGSMIAFSASYDGNTDVYVLPVSGGIPKRLTWHPYGDLVRGWTPAGEVLFLSGRSIHTSRYSQLHKIAPEGGFPERLIVPHANRACYSPDGDKIAYSPAREVYLQWKNYRGGTMSRIWLFDFASHEVDEIPKPTGGSNDNFPMWLDDQVIFLSDRDGEFNLYSYQPEQQTVSQLTDHQDFPITWASAHQQEIIYAQAGKLHIFDVATGKDQALKVGISTDLAELRPRFVDGDDYIRSANISHDGNRAIFDLRGEVVSVPKEKGDPVNLTQSPGAHDKYPAWSPDGTHIAWFTDQGGEYGINLHNTETGNNRMIALDGAGFYFHIHWSPDSKHLVFSDNSRSIYLMDVALGEVSTISQDYFYGPGVSRDLFGDWSPDAKWIAYTQITSSSYQTVFLYSLAEGKSYPVTDGLSNATSPAFDASGKYLYFLASTDAGPVVNWFDQSNQDMRATQNVYMAILNKDLPSPLAPESDEVAIVPADEEEETEASDEEAEAEEISIDPEDIAHRIVDLPIETGVYRSLKAGKEGNLYLIHSESNKLHHFELASQKTNPLFSLYEYWIAADRKHVLYWWEGGLFIRSLMDKSADPQKLDLRAVKIKMDPTAEWRNIFYEAWRINRDYFYDPGMHGADWEEMKEKYEPFLDHLSCRRDLNTLIQWMCSELGVGHHRMQGSGDDLVETDYVPGGLLGADYAIKDGYYQITKIYGGLNWNPGLRAPLTEPGLNIEPGTFLIAVDGQELTAATNLFSLFEHKAGKRIKLTLATDPQDAATNRTVEVTPVESEYSLRNRNWVEQNLQYVNEQSEGKLAYVYVPNTAGAGHEYFKRYFFPQADREGIIVDERYNGGGQISDYYIDLLTRPYQSYWNFRYGHDLKTPSASIQGPKVLIIDENAGSGGDMFPWMFRKFEVGTMVGKTTWGGLVGVLGFPEFIDGGSVTAPNVAIWTKDGFIVENVGVAPDVEVENWPKDLIEGRDPQLDKAIEIALEQLKAKPVAKPQRPPYPKRVRD